LIRPFEIRDVLGLRALQRQVADLDFEGMVLDGSSPLRLALRHLLPVYSSGTRTLMYLPDGQTAVRHGGRHPSFVQTRRRVGGRECDICRLAPPLDTVSAAALSWQRLISAACQAEVGSGVERFFARVNENDRLAVQVLRQAGFVAYANDTVMRLMSDPAGPGNVGDSAGLTPLEASDYPDAARLRDIVTPVAVQRTEGLTPWERHVPAGWPGLRTTLWAWRASDGLAGCVSATYGQGRSWLRFLLDPDRADRADHLVRSALDRLELRELAGLVYCSVRGYEPGIRLALQNVGFQLVANRYLLVKHATVWVKEPEWSTVVGTELPAEPAAGRTPLGIGPGLQAAGSTRHGSADAHST
jgi:hypothetical protein